MIDPYFAELGRAVEAAAPRWDDDEFTDIAKVVLADHDPPPRVTAASVLSEAALADRLPRQHDPLASFGEPPITVYRGDGFFISVIVWFDGTTAIHDHGFSGAFRVLQGSSVHTSFRYEPTQSFAEELTTGTLTSLESEVLRVGDIRGVGLGERGIHSLFHLDRPSATLLIRTDRPRKPTSEHAFLRPGLASDAYAANDDRMAQVNALQALQRLDSDAAFQVASDIADGRDAWLAYLMLMQWFRRRRGLSLNKLLDRFENAHPDLGTVVRRALALRSTELLITARRRRVSDPQARMFLALLMTVPGESAACEVLRLLDGRAPEGDESTSALLRRVLSGLWDAGFGEKLEMPLATALKACHGVDQPGGLEAALQRIAGAIPPTPAESELAVS